MMDNKSELSKPVGFVSKLAQTFLKCGETASIRPFFDVQGSSPLYSQEYVSALKHESAVNWEAAASLNVENQELKKRIAELEDAEQRLCAANVTLDARASEAEAKLATPVRLPTKYSMLHREDFHDDYQSKMVFKADEVIAALRAHGSTVEGDE